MQNALRSRNRRSSDLSGRFARSAAGLRVQPADLQPQIVYAFIAEKKAGQNTLPRCYGAARYSVATYRNPSRTRKFSGLLDVSMSFSWVYYKTKGYKKASCRNGTRLLVLLCFSGCYWLSELVIFRLNEFVSRQVFLIPTRQANPDFNCFCLGDLTRRDSV